MEFQCGKLNSRKLAQVSGFLRSRSLAVPEQIPDYSVCAYQDGVLAATGSIEGSTLKYIAVDPDYEGEGLCAQIVSALVTYAIGQGMDDLMLCTKPEHAALFRGVGFYPVGSTSDMLLMENHQDGIQRYIASLPKPESGSVIGAVVGHGDPFTKGHRYLAEQASQNCDFLYYFVVSEDQGMFRAEERLMMARESLRDLKNVCVCPTRGYMVSSATFPAYFLRDQSRVEESSAELDLKIFAECFAKELSITKRYVGEEPFSTVTKCYNEEMVRTLPGYGIIVEIIPRLLDVSGTAISAGRVRTLLKEGLYEQVRELVTEETYALIEKIRT